MVYQNSTVPFEKMLMEFVADDDPMQEMLKWLCERLMAAEVDGKLEAYVNGVSTRKIPKLTISLGIDSISRSQVSAITKN